MSLFDKITEGFSQVSELFSKQETNAKDALNESNKTAPTSFWANLFGKSSTPNFNQNAGLRFTAQNIQLSNEDIKASHAREAARFNPSASSGQVKVYQEGVQTDGTYVANVLPGDVGAARWSKEISPADVARVGLRKAALGLGIANNADEAQKIVDHLSVTGLHKGKTAINNTDLGFGAWMKQQTIRRGQLQIHSGAEEIALLRASARELKIGNPDVAVIPPGAATKQADARILAAGTLALPKIGEQLPKAAILAGEAAPPLLAVGTGVVLGGALINQHYEVSKSNWEDQEKAKVMPLPIPMPDLHMEDAGDAPPAQPTDTAERPAQPNAQPIPDEADLPKGGLEVKPQAQPPTIPQQPQSQPPQVPKIIPPIIAGGAGFVLGKLASDKLGTRIPKPEKIYEVTPSLQPDATREPMGRPEAIKNSNPAEMQEAKKAQNEAARTLAKAGYRIEQSPEITQSDRINNPWFKATRKPDYKIEGEIFDAYMPQNGTPALNIIKEIQRGKIEEGQARRIVLIMDRNNSSLDELNDALKKNPVVDLHQILVLRDGQINRLYPPVN